MEQLRTVNFGRLVSEDQQDKKFLMGAILPEKISTDIRYWNANSWWGDQGNTPKCVAYSLTHWLMDGPITHKKIIPNPDFLYKRAQDLDEWEGNNYDGTSVRGGMKALQEHGYIQEYRWTWNIDDLITALLTVGPVVVGTTWLSDMIEPDAKGIIHATGFPVGGHAYKLDGINLKTKLIRIKNSWGRSWGHKGFAYISVSEMAELISEANQGECCLAIENE